jgi:putative transposase
MSTASPHDYKRHGTTTLFAALNLLDGSVLAQCKPCHRHQEFLSFLRYTEANVPAELDIHLVTVGPSCTRNTGQMSVVQPSQIEITQYVLC